MKKTCETCKHQPIPPDLEPCLHCLRLPPIFRRSGGIDRVDNWQPAKPRRKELIAEIGEWTRQYNAAQKRACDAEALVAEKNTDIERLKRVVDTLKNENAALYNYRTKTINIHAEKDAEIERLQNKLTNAIDINIEMNRKIRSLAAEQQAQQDLLPVGTKVMLTGTIMEVDKNDMVYTYEIQIDAGDGNNLWFSRASVKPLNHD